MLLVVVLSLLNVLYERLQTYTTPPISSENSRARNMGLQHKNTAMGVHHVYAPYYNFRAITWHLRQNNVLQGIS